MTPVSTLASEAKAGLRLMEEVIEGGIKMGDVKRDVFRVEWKARIWRWEIEGIVDVWAFQACCERCSGLVIWLALSS